MLVRRERPGDVAAIARVHTAAFAAAGGPSPPVEVALVAALRRSAAWIPELSLVAVAPEGDGSETADPLLAAGRAGRADRVVGHVLCSRAHLGPRDAPVLGLGPVGVLPAHQRRRVGSALLHAVLGAADARHEALVALLGEASFYRRFGFVPAATLGIEAPDAGWGEHFQVRVLEAWTPQLRGAFRYAAAFDDLGGDQADAGPP